MEVDVVDHHIQEVSGSHRWPEFPQDQMDDLMAPHPDEVYITGPAGSVGFFNGQIWHGALPIIRTGRDGSKARPPPVNIM